MLLSRFILLLLEKSPWPRKHFEFHAYNYTCNQIREYQVFSLKNVWLFRKIGVPLPPNCEKMMKEWYYKVAGHVFSVVGDDSDQ